MAKPTKPLRVHLEKLTTPLDPGTEAGLQEHAKHSPKGAAEMRAFLEEPTTECGQGKGVSLDHFKNHAEEARCKKCNGKAGNPRPEVRETFNPESAPITWETARTLVRVLARSFPGRPLRLAVEVQPSAIVKTIDNERDALETIRRGIERDGPLPAESTDPEAEDATLPAWLKARTDEARAKLAAFVRGEDSRPAGDA